MGNEFDTALKDLYKTFSKYSLKTEIDGCSCCVSKSDKSKIHSKSLRELDDDDLSYYASKAMTTFGDLEDFKHFLPRIFELSAKKDLLVDTSIILGKLKYGKWENWDKKEQEAILNFLYSWWSYDINSYRCFNPFLLVEINTVIKNLPSLLEKWNLEKNTGGFKSFVDLVENDYHDLIDESYPFNELSNIEGELFISWIEKNIPKLEKAI